MIEKETHEAIFKMIAEETEKGIRRYIDVGGSEREKRLAALVDQLTMERGEARHAATMNLTERKLVLQENQELRATVKRLQQAYLPGNWEKLEEIKAELLESQAREARYANVLRKLEFKLMPRRDGSRPRYALDEAFGHIMDFNCSGRDLTLLDVLDKVRAALVDAEGDAYEVSQHRELVALIELFDRTFGRPCYTGQEPVAQGESTPASGAW